MSEQRQSTIVKEPTVHEPRAVILERSPTVRLDISQANQTARYFQERIKQEKDNPEAVAELTRQKELNRQAHVQEMSLLHATSIKALYETVAAHPFSSKEEILRIIKETTPVLTPDLIEALARQIEVTSESIRALRDHFSRDGELHTEFLANSVLIAVSDKDKLTENKDMALFSPKKIEITDTTVILTLDATTFSYVVHSEGTAGLFFTKVTVSSPAGKVATFPAIILREDQPTERTTEHEVGHSKNAFYKQSFNGENTKLSPVALVHSWGRTLPSTELANTYALLEKKFRTPTLKQNKTVEVTVLTENVEQTKEFQDCIKDALSRAKDELLAEMHATKGDPNGHLENLKDPQGVYVYFTELTQNIDPTLHTLLWNEYTQQLTEFSREALALHTAYKKHSAFRARRELLPYVLMNIPIDKWNEQLEQKGYLAEVRLYQEIQSIEAMLIDQNDAIGGLEAGNTRTESRTYYGKIREKYNKIAQKGRSLFEELFDSSHSLLLEFSQIKQELDTLLAEHQETEPAQIATATMSVKKTSYTLLKQLNHGFLNTAASTYLEKYTIDIRRLLDHAISVLSSQMPLEVKLQHAKQAVMRMNEFSELETRVHTELFAVSKAVDEKVETLYEKLDTLKNSDLKKQIQDKDNDITRSLQDKLGAATDLDSTLEALKKTHNKLTLLQTELDAMIEAELPFVTRIQRAIRSIF